MYVRYFTRAASTFVERNRKERSSKRCIIRTRACDKIAMLYALGTARRWYVYLFLDTYRSRRDAYKVRANGSWTKKWKMLLHIMRVCHSKLSTFVDIFFPEAKHLVKQNEIFVRFQLLKSMNLIYARRQTAFER